MKIEEYWGFKADTFWRLTVTAVWFLGFCASLSAPAQTVSLTFDLSVAGKVITNKFGDVNVWRVDETWTRRAAAWPKDYFHSNFPFVQRVQLMAATGGNEQRDLFKNPQDRSTLNDYAFAPLLAACQNIVAQGLEPMIKTGWVPLKLSAHPHLGVFGTNVRPPSDYEEYYRYIRALATALKDRFGTAEMKTWSWGVGVENENRDWFEADDGKPETTKLAYFRLYDCTVAALEDALGKENVTVGAHSMTISPGLWNSLDFIEHCARGQNLYRGGTGAGLDFLAISYYTPVPGFDPATFTAAIDRVQNRASQLGLRELKFGIDEGRVLEGWDKKVLYPREVEHPIQAAGDARLFQLMVEQNVDYFSTWDLTTEGIFGGIPLASSNFRNLAFRLTGSSVLAASRTGAAAGSSSVVNGLAAYDAAAKMVRVLVYNFSPARDASATEEVRLTIAHLKHAGAGSLILHTWALDEDNGNWWKAWQADVAARKMGPAAFRNTVWTTALPAELANPADVQFWKARQADYEKLSRLKCVEQRLAPGPDDTLVWSARLQPYGVVLYEIPLAEP
jgi:hypothetical protein